MNELLKKFLNGIGVSDDTIETLFLEEQPAEFELEPLIENYQDVQTKLFENKNKERLFDQKELDKKFKIVKDGHAMKLNKLFNLGYTRKEVEEMEYEEIVKKSEEKMTTAIADAQGTNDEQLVEQVKNLQVELSESKDEITSVTERFEGELTKAKGDYDHQLNEIQLGQVFKSEFDKYKYGLDAALVPVIQAQVEREVRKTYVVKADGTLEGKDGTHPTSYEGKGIYDNVSQPVKYLLDKYNAIAKVQTVDDKTTIKTPTGQYVEENLSPAAKALLERQRQKAN